MRRALCSAAHPKQSCHSLAVQIISVTGSNMASLMLMPASAATGTISGSQQSGAISPAVLQPAKREFPDPKLHVVLVYETFGNIVNDCDEN